MADGNNKAKDKRPARARYWAMGKLAMRKVKAILRHAPGRDVMAIYEAWRASRKRGKLPSPGVYPEGLVKLAKRLSQLRKERP